VESGILPADPRGRPGELRRSGRTVKFGVPERHSPCRTCLTVSRFHRMAGRCQTWMDMRTDQVFCGPMWLGGGGRWQPVGLPV